VCVCVSMCVLTLFVSVKCLCFKCVRVYVKCVNCVCRGCARVKCV